MFLQLSKAFQGFAEMFCFCSVEKTCKSQVTLDVMVVENGSPFPDVV